MRTVNFSPKYWRHFSQNQILGDAYQLGLVAEGKPIKVAVEFSLEDPRGGIHFVVPDGKFYNF